MGIPAAAVKIKSLGTDAKLLEKLIANFQLLGSNETLKWSQDADALTIEPPQQFRTSEAIVFKIASKN
jgi:alpha-L-fucosidase